VKPAACVVVAVAMVVSSSAHADATDSSDYAWLRMVTISGYIQPQLVWQLSDAAGSANANASGVLPTGIGANSVTATSSGTTTNPDYFRLRRARLRTDVTPTDAARVTLEIEPIAKGGPTNAVGSYLRTVEAVGIAKLPDGAFLEFAMGQFNLPFSGEILEPNSGRPFIDSSWTSGNLFPGDFATGARALLAASRLTVMASIVNGVMLGESTYALQPDPSRDKDFTLRADYDAAGFWDFGVSGDVGGGHIVDATTLRFKTYPRWATSVETTFHRAVWPSLGQTKVVAAVTAAMNMDRGVTYAFALPSFPTALSNDVVNRNEIGYFTRVEQDASRWLTFGVRYDAYTPDRSFSDDLRRTVSGVGVLHFTTKIQLMLEYDYAVDHVHAQGTPVLNKLFDTMSAVLQGKFST
jgi:hypothetical protein